MISRRSFLKTLGGLAGMAFLDPPENPIYMPMVSSGSSSGAYVKLAEFPVPDGHICPSWSFVEFGEYPKYIIELTARMNATILWYPCLRMDDDNNSEHYEQICSYNQSNMLSATPPTNIDPAELQHFAFPPAQLWGELEHPYTIKIEITNLPKMYKTITATGSMFAGISAPLLMFSFHLSGLYRSTDLLEKMVLFSNNYPESFFNSNSVVSLYGVH